MTRRKEGVGVRDEDGFHDYYWLFKDLTRDGTKK